jgi:nucleoid-associated protein EbfC
MPENDSIDFGALARRARDLQGQMSNIQSGLAALEATGFGGDGLVTATVSGKGRLTALRIDPSVIDPDDPETLTTMIIAAVDGANDAMLELRNDRASAITDGLQTMLDGLRPGPDDAPRVVPMFPSLREGYPRPGA